MSSEILKIENLKKKFQVSERLCNRGLKGGGFVAF